MLHHTRAIIAAAAYAFIFRKKIAGVHDHTEKRDLQIAAETRGEHLQAYDGDRSERFDGDLPELYHSGNEAFVSLAIDGLTARGYDRNSSNHYSLTATDGMVQLYDHGPDAWFAFSIRAI